MNRLSLTPQKRIFIGLTLISLVFTISLLLPFSEQRHLNESEEWLMTTYTMFYQNQLIWLFIANYTVIIFAALSNNRILLMIVTILVTIWSYALYFLFSYAFGWDGQPIHATFGLGYYMSQFVMLVLFFFSFRWERLLKQIQPTKIHVRIFNLLTIAVPVVMGTAIFLTIRHNKNLPIKRSEDVFIRGSKYVKNESWDYTEKYNVYVQQYFSRDTSANENTPYQIDSIKIQFNTQDRIIRKRIKDEEFDLDAYLEKMCD